MKTRTEWNEVFQGLKQEDEEEEEKHHLNIHIQQNYPSKIMEKQRFSQINKLKEFIASRIKRQDMLKVLQR